MLVLWLRFFFGVGSQVDGAAIDFYGDVHGERHRLRLSLVDKSSQSVPLSNCLLQCLSGYDPLQLLWVAIDNVWLRLLHRWPELIELDLHSLGKGLESAPLVDRLLLGESEPLADQVLLQCSLHLLDALQVLRYRIGDIVRVAPVGEFHHEEQLLVAASLVLLLFLCILDVLLLFLQLVPQLSDVLVESVHLALSFEEQLLQPQVL